MKVTFLFCWASFALAGSTFAEAQWWKGNLHTHTLWSDGDDYPEQIAKWYKDHGYHFLTLTDHNTLQTGERWSDVMKNRGGPPALAKYQAAWGKWVQTRERNGRLEVRLKTLEEFRGRLEVPGGNHGSLENCAGAHERHQPQNAHQAQRRQ
ncbi:MAG TPA: hypothetical protein EYQ62_02235 [Verrucomicrobiales bacterium]|nr:hypothetical protein [Verrucomicrobiales bacterium]